MGLAEKLFYINLPPTVAADDPEHQVLSDVTGAGAASFDWYAQLVAADAEPDGKVFVTVEAVTTDAFIRFSETASTGTTASNGLLIKAGSPGTKFYVKPWVHQYIDHIAPAGAGVLKLYVSSPIGERHVI